MDKASVARFLTLVVGLLAYFGVDISDAVVDAIVDIIIGGYILYMAYKNNDFTAEAKQATLVMREEKARNKRLKETRKDGDK